MPAVLCAHRGDHASREDRVSVLYGRLRSLNHQAAPADAAVTTCLVWVAGVLVGIAGDLADPRSAGALVHEASAVLAGVSVLAEVPVPPGPACRVPLPVEPLTSRQLAVLRQLQEEVPLRQIADGMFLSYNTVKSHARAVYRKLGASSRAEAVGRARELGLV